MRTAFLCLSTVLLACGGCAAQRSVRCAPDGRAGEVAQAPQPGFFVPAATLARGATSRPINPYAVLADAGDEDVFFPRPEKVVYGPELLYQASAFTIFDYDAQNISTPFSTGFRYRWVVRQGVEVP